MELNLIKNDLIRRNENMKIVKITEAEEFKNSENCKDLEYPLNDKSIDIANSNFKYLLYFLLYILKF